MDRVHVGEVLTLQRREVHPEPSSSYNEIGVRSFGRGIFHKEPVSGADLGTKRVFRIEPGDLVLSNVFAWEGAIAVASESEAGRIGSHRFMTFTPNGDRIDASWARWWFLSEPGLELIQIASPGSAGRNRTLAIDRFLSIEIPLPSIEEQRSVAARIDVLARSSDSVSAALRARDRAALLQLLPGLVDEVIEETATGRSVVKDLVDFVSDTVHPGDDPAPAAEFVGLQHVEGHTGKGLGSDPLSSMKGRKFRFRPGDVIYGYLRPYQNKVWVADRHGLCSVDQYVLRPRPGVNAELLAYALRGRRTLTTAIDLTHSLQLPRLRSGLLGAIEIPTVTGDQGPVVVSKLDDLRDRIARGADIRRHQQNLADALLPAALNEAFAGLS